MSSIQSRQCHRGGRYVQTVDFSACQATAGATTVERRHAPAVRTGRYYPYRGGWGVSEHWEYSTGAYRPYIRYRCIHVPQHRRKPSPAAHHTANLRALSEPLVRARQRTASASSQTEHRGTSDKPPPLRPSRERVSERVVSEHRHNPPCSGRLEKRVSERVVSEHRHIKPATHELYSCSLEPSMLYTIVKYFLQIII